MAHEQTKNKNKQISTVAQHRTCTSIGQRTLENIFQEKKCFQYLIVLHKQLSIKSNPSKSCGMSATRNDHAHTGSHTHHSSVSV